MDGCIIGAFNSSVFVVVVVVVFKAIKVLSNLFKMKSVSFLIYR